MRFLIFLSLFMALLAAVSVSSAETNALFAADAVFTTNTYFATNTIVMENNGVFITNRIAMTNMSIQRAVMEEVSTNNGVVFTRTHTAYGSDPASDYNSVHDGEKAKATFSGGDGSSVKGAVVITASNEETGVRAAYIWLHDHYPNSHFKDEGTDYDDAGNQYLEVEIVATDGKSYDVVFDITSFFGK
jgi:hypothetical protein